VCAPAGGIYEEKALPAPLADPRQHLANVVTRQSAQGPAAYVHAAGEELGALPAMGDPFYAGWGAGLIAVVLRDDGTTDWSEVKELLADSYCLIAPKS
jgi:hypothetical protein